MYGLCSENAATVGGGEEEGVVAMTGEVVMVVAMAEMVAEIVDEMVGGTATFLSKLPFFYMVITVFNRRLTKPALSIHVFCSESLQCCCSRRRSPEDNRGRRRSPSYDRAR